MILTKYLKVGSRIRIQCASQNKRCIVEEVGEHFFKARPILVDRDTSDEWFNVGAKNADEYEEWGVTKLYRVTLDVSVDHDYVQCQPDDEAMQDGLDKKYDGSMLIIKSDYELIDVEENDMPDPDPAKTRLKNLRETIAALEKQLPREEFKKLCEVSRTIAMGGKRS